jgi:hypothetical protein
MVLCKVRLLLVRRRAAMTLLIIFLGGGGCIADLGMPRLVKFSIIAPVCGLRKLRLLMFPEDYGFATLGEEACEKSNSKPQTVRVSHRNE